MGLITELRRRNVLRMAVLYLGAAWLVMQVVDVLEGPLSLPEWSGGAVLAVLTVGFPIVLILSWFYEVTPEGVIPDEGVRTSGAVPAAGRRLDFVVIAVLAAAVLLFAYDKWWPDESAKPSIAVLPFDNLGSTDVDDYIAAGLTDTLRNALQPLDIRVAPKSSTNHVAGQGNDVLNIAGKLGVSNVLHGSILTDDDRIRVVVELSEVASQSRRWGNTYDREMLDIFSVLDDIAGNVVAQLQVELQDFEGQKQTSIDTVSTDNLAAYESYLQGLARAKFQDLAAAELFKKALALDPNFIEAELELVHHYLWRLDFGAISSLEASELINPHIDRLKKRSAGDPRVQSLELALLVDIRTNDIGALRLGYPGVDQSIEELVAAIERSPNDMSLARQLMILLSIAGRLKEKLEWADRVIESDPYLMTAHFHRARTLASMGRLEEARDAAVRAKAINPTSSLEDLIMVGIAWRRRDFLQWMDFDQAHREKEALDPEIWVFSAINFYRLGLRQAADDFLERARSLDADHDFVRAAGLYQSLIGKDYGRAAEVSLALLKEDIDNRGGAYWISTAGYLQSMIALERLDEALATMETLRPGVLSPDFSPQNVKELALHYHAVLALARSLSPDEIAATLDSAVKTWDVSFPYWRSNPGLVAPILFARGDRDTAIELMLDELGQGLAKVNHLDHNSLYWGFYQYDRLRQEAAIARGIEDIEKEALRAGRVIREHYGDERIL